MKPNLRRPFSLVFFFSFLNTFWEPNTVLRKTKGKMGNYVNMHYLQNMDKENPKNAIFISCTRVVPTLHYPKMLLYVF